MNADRVFRNGSEHVESNKEKRILVVEDERFWADLLKLELKEIEPKIEIVHAENGEVGVKRIKESGHVRSGDKEGGIRYDAIIMDIQMPVMDGCTAVKIIRDLLYTGPIIVWSAYRDSPEDLKKALDIPVSGFCVKESSLKNLLSLLRNLNVID